VPQAEDREEAAPEPVSTLDPAVVLPVAVRASDGVAQLGLPAMNTLVDTQIPFIHVDTLHLPAALIGWVMLIATF